MCLSVIFWARLRPLYFGNTRKDAARIGFDDDILYDEVTKPLPNRTIPMRQLLRREALAAFREWDAKADKTPYQGRLKLRTR
jgi:tRNA(Arg) A34 adenosine deaminase TadA